MTRFRSAIIPAALVSLATLTHGADIDAPAFYLDFNHLTNSTIVSQAPVPLSGIVLGPLFEPYGYIAGAYTFDGIDDQVIFGPSTVFNLSNFTVSAWVRSVDYNEAVQNIFASLTTTVSQGGFNLVVLEYDLRMAVRYQDDTERQYLAEDVFTESDNNQWRFLLGTHAYDGVNSTCKLYVDGDLVLSETVPTGAPTYSFQNVFVGDNYDTGYKREFHGDIDELRLYDCVLEQADIDDLFLIGTLQINNAIELSWYAQAGQTYQLQRTDVGSPMTWTNDGGVVTGQNAVVNFFRSRNDPPCMYRLVSGP